MSTQILNSKSLNVQHLGKIFRNIEFLWVNIAVTGVNALKLLAIILDCSKSGTRFADRICKENCIKSIFLENTTPHTYQA